MLSDNNFKVEIIFSAKGGVSDVEVKNVPPQIQSKVINCSLGSQVGTVAKVANTYPPERAKQICTTLRSKIANCLNISGNRVVISTK